MRVYLEASVFIHAKEWCLPLVWFARVGRHRVLPTTGARTDYEAWRAQLSTSQQADVDHAETWSIQEEASSSSTIEIVVNEPPSPGQTSVATAWTILQRPYRVLVEDGFNDTSFLLRMAGAAERAFLVRYIEREWVQPDHGGGISSMPRRVRQLAKAGPPLLASCLFDSDSSQPGKPSADSLALETACVGTTMHHYRLRRRAIENYLPRSAYERWISLGTDHAERKRRRGLVFQFFAQPDTARHHGNVKKQVGAVGSLYGDDTAIDQQDTTREGGPEELRTFIDELIERIR